MLQVYTGIYENGQVIFYEKPDVKIKTKVIVTFLEDRIFEKNITNEKRILGTLNDKINVPDDFDEPLDDLKDYMY